MNKQALSSLCDNKVEQGLINMLKEITKETKEEET
jgi:hypothetical protein